MTKTITFSILLLTTIAFCSCKRTVIEGKILDGFGQPVKDATVKVEGTQFTSQSNGNGEYSVSYVPGDIKVLISKEGFTETSFTVKISTESTFPAETMTIYEIPKEEGIFILQDGNYKALNKTPVKMHEFGDCAGMHSGFTWVPCVFVYFINYDNSNIMTIKQRDVPTIFADNKTNNMKLYKIFKSKYASSTIMEENEDFSLKTISISQDIQSFNNSFVIRSSKLEVGDYVFAQYQNSLGHYIVGDAYIFRVIN